METSTKNGEEQVPKDELTVLDFLKANAEPDVLAYLEKKQAEINRRKKKLAAASVPATSSEENASEATTSSDVPREKRQKIKTKKTMPRVPPLPKRKSIPSSPAEKAAESDDALEVVETLEVVEVHVSPAEIQNMENCGEQVLEAEATALHHTEKTMDHAITTGQPVSPSAAETKSSEARSPEATRSQNAAELPMAQEKPTFKGKMPTVPPLPKRKSTAREEEPKCKAAKKMKQNLLIREASDEDKAPGAEGAAPEEKNRHTEKKRKATVTPDNFLDYVRALIRAPPHLLLEFTNRVLEKAMVKRDFLLTGFSLEYGANMAILIEYLQTRPKGGLSNTYEDHMSDVRIELNNARKVLISQEHWKEDKVPAYMYNVFVFPQGSREPFRFSCKREQREPKFQLYLVFHVCHIFGRPRNWNADCPMPFEMEELPTVNGQSLIQHVGSNGEKTAFFRIPPFEGEIEDERLKFTISPPKDLRRDDRSSLVMQLVHIRQMDDEEILANETNRRRFY